MIRRLKILFICLAVVLTVGGCSAGNYSGESQPGEVGKTEQEEQTLQSSAPLDSATYPADMFSERDLNPQYDEKTATKIELASQDVEITEEGTYIISGTLSDGQIVVNASDKEKIQLVLNNAKINASSSAAIYVKSADKVFITLAGGTKNTLSVGGEYQNTDENNVDAVIFSKDDITFNGSGKLIINGNVGHGIVGKDDVKFCGGTYEIEAENKGISGNDSIRIADGDFTVKSGKDSFHAENTGDETKGFVYIANGTFNIDSKYDGISASGTLQIDDGDFNIKTGGGSENASSATGNAGDGFSGATRPQRPGGDTDAGSGSDSGSDNESGIINTSYDVMSSATGSQKNEDSSSNKPQPPQMPQESLTPENQGENTDDTTSGQDESTSFKGIKSAAGLTINSGTFNINSEDDGIHSNGDIAINGGTFVIESGDDAVHGDGNLVVNDGDITVKTCYEGLEGLSVTIKAGNIDIYSSDDGINAADGSGGQMGGGFGGHPGGGFGGRPEGPGDGRGDKSTPGGEIPGGEITGGGEISGGGGTPGGQTNEDCFIRIEGGTIKIVTSGNDADGIDSNGNLFVTGGTIHIYGTAPIDYDGNATITGGTVIAYGGANMAQNFGNDSTQGSYLVRLSQTAQAGATAVLKDQSAGELLTFSIEDAAQCIIISTPDLENGGNYSLEVAGKTYELS